MSKEILKKWLKLIKEYEENASMIIGFFVVVVLSGLVFVVIKDFSHFLSPQKNEANQVKNDVKLHENQILSPTPSERNGATFSVVESNDGQTHVVEPGEGLWQIAVKYYGDGNQYLKIYEANKNEMKSPEDIRVGMELRIPFE